MSVRIQLMTGDGVDCGRVCNLVGKVCSGCDVVPLTKAETERVNVQGGWVEAPEELSELGKYEFASAQRRQLGI